MPSTAQRDEDEGTGDGSEEDQGSGDQVYKCPGAYADLKPVWTTSREGLEPPVSSEEAEVLRSLRLQWPVLSYVRGQQVESSRCQQTQ